MYGANLETAKISKIASNDRLGYPNFATNDDRIAYSTTNGLNMQVIKSVKVLPDKITPYGDAGVLVPEAKWPVYFAKGIRSLGLAPVSYFTTDYKYGNFPLTVRFMDLSLNKPASWLWTFEGGTPDSSREENPQVTFEIPGNYKVTLITQNSFGSDTLIREHYIHVINPTSVDNPDAATLDIYPNPVADMLTIACAGDFIVKIYNLQGGLEVSGANTSQLDLHGLKPGMYILELRTNKSLLPAETTETIAKQEFPDIHNSFIPGI